MRIPRLELRPDLCPRPFKDAPTERFLATLEALERHPGGLSTIYLFALVCPGVKDKANFSDMLQRGFHHGYFARPRDLNIKSVPNNQAVYQITDKGRALLTKYLRQCKFPFPPSNVPVHDYMTSCITASIEIAAKAAGYKFISSSEILMRPATRNPARSPFEIPSPVSPKTFTCFGKKYKEWAPAKTTITPDAFFGIDYRDHEMFFALETDRDTEDACSSDKKKNSLLSKLLRWNYVMTHHENRVFPFQKHFGIETLKLLFVTVNEPRVKLFENTIKELIRLPRSAGGGAGASYIALKHIPRFGNYENPPIMREIFREPWMVAGLPPYLMNQI